MNNVYLEKSILSTICYFDVFEYPLTLIEIWQWLFVSLPPEKNIDLLMIIKTIENSAYLSEKISFKNGFYFLCHRDEIVLTRLKRYTIANQKNKIAKRGVQVLKYLPFIKLIGLCNNSGNNNIREDSDIDLFIITAKNRLFTARFLITLVTSLMRLRRHDKKITNRLCLSFYVSDDNLDFSKIKIIDDDIYLIYWIANIFPLYDRGSYQNFLAANNWIRRSLPNYLPKAGSYWRQIFDHPISRGSFKSLEYLLGGYLGDQLELWLKKLQLLKMSKNNKSLAKENDSRVIINDTMLKFHENDRRLLYQNSFISKLKEIL